MSIEGETESIQTKNGSKIHTTTCVRPYIKSTFEASKVDERSEKEMVGLDQLENMKVENDISTKA